MDKKAVILLSGGLDSATAAGIAADIGFDLYAMTFLYGQRHSVELESAKRLASFFKMKKHIVVDIPSEIFASSLIRGSGQDVPKNRDMGQMEIPSTYVPARNIIFLSYALGFGESIGSYDIFIGANAVDYSGYPDCRPEFFNAYQDMAAKGTRAGTEGRKFFIHTPLLYLKKSEIIKKGLELGIDYSMTHSCYDPDETGRACGFCDSCVLRKKGFAEAGAADPTIYSDKLP